MDFLGKRIVQVGLQMVCLHMYKWFSILYLEKHDDMPGIVYIILNTNVLQGTKTCSFYAFIAFLMANNFLTCKSVF